MRKSSWPQTKNSLNYWIQLNSKVPPCSPIIAECFWS
jgi:hypothetical protein